MGRGATSRGLSRGRRRRPSSRSQLVARQKSSAIGHLRSGLQRLRSRQHIRVAARLPGVPIGQGDGEFLGPRDPYTAAELLYLRAPDPSNPEARPVPVRPRARAQLGQVQGSRARRRGVAAPGIGGVVVGLGIRRRPGGVILDVAGGVGTFQLGSPWLPAGPPPPLLLLLLLLLRLRASLGRIVTHPLPWGIRLLLPVTAIRTEKAGQVHGFLIDEG